MRAHSDVVHDGSSNRWHPWLDKPGIPHPLTLEHFSSLEEALTLVARHRLFVLCSDILDQREFPYINDLLGHDQTIPYLSRSGKVSALRVKNKKSSGFLVPASTWCWHEKPDKQLTENLGYIFKAFGFQATTPSSLSEKVLRSTLPEKLHIHRPSVMLRRDILDNNVGGRIDTAIPSFYSFVREYDKNKAYLYHSCSVPSPYLSPVVHYFPPFDVCLEYPTGWWRCQLVAHAQEIAPIQIEGRNPEHGEVIDRWLWTGELQDSLEAGYTLVSIQAGYGFRALSDFMELWADTLWEAYQKAGNEHPHIRQVLKQMMVGLPGRFLRQPELYTLIPIGEAKPGIDIPIQLHWTKQGDQVFSDYAVHPEYDRESTTLSPIGSYIVSEMRRELYHKMKEAHERGFTVIRSYIDCFSVAGHNSNDDNFSNALPCEIIGTGLGQWKEKIYRDVWAEENRFIGVTGEGEREMRAPGFDSKNMTDQRIKLWQKYNRIVENFPIDTLQH